MPCLSTVIYKHITASKKNDHDLYINLKKLGIHDNMIDHYLIGQYVEVRMFTISCVVFACMYYGIMYIFIE